MQSGADSRPVVEWRAPSEHNDNRGWRRSCVPLCIGDAGPCISSLDRIPIRKVVSVSWGTATRRVQKRALGPNKRGRSEERSPYRDGVGHVRHRRLGLSVRVAHCHVHAHALPVSPAFMSTRVK